MKSQNMIISKYNERMHREGNYTVEFLEDDEVNGYEKGDIVKMWQGPAEQKIKWGTAKLIEIRELPEVTTPIEILSSLKDKDKIKVEENIELTTELLRAFIRKDKKRINKAIEKIVQKLKKRVHIYTWKDDNIPEMWVYNAGQYKKNGECYITEELRKMLGETYEERLLHQILARIRPDTYIEPKKFIEMALDHTYEIPVKNGIVCINPNKDYEVTLIPHTPDKIFLHQINATYDPNAKCTKIDRFLEETMADKDDRATTYESVGTGLDPGLITKKACFYYGPPDTGKTTWTNTLNNFYGKDSCSNLTLKQITEDKFSIAQMFGMIANIAGDLSQDEVHNLETFKTLTGGDTQEGDRKYKTNIRFKGSAKFFYNLNQLPRLYNADQATWERIMAFEFVKRFIPKDDYDKLSEEEQAKVGIRDIELEKKMNTDEELSGLLNRAIEGLINYYKNKQFSYSRGADEVKKRWVRLSDSFMAFCIENVESGEPNDYITRKELSSKYHKYCIKHKVKGVSDKSIRATLNSEYGVYTEGYTCVPGSNERNWEGIRFTDTRRCSICNNIYNVTCGNVIDGIWRCSKCMKCL
jgi:putative DNA primase/helicase